MPSDKTPTAREGSVPRSEIREDEEMTYEKEPDGTDTTEKDPSHAAKRQRNAEGGYYVSETAHPSRDHSPLRKTAPQSVWNYGGHTQLAQQPAASREWVEKYADRMPYHPEHDEIRWAAIPTGRRENPHLQYTQREPRPEQPLPGHAEFTPCPLPATYIHPWRLFVNLDEAQRKMLEKDISRFLGIVPHGGGRAINEQAPELCSAIEEVLWTFQFAGYGGESIKVTVLPPDPKTVAGPNGTNNFAPPWTLFLDLIHDEKGLLRDFLLDQQHFAFDPARSFSVFSLDPEQSPSWKTLLLVSPLINHAGATHSDVVTARAKIREHVIRALEQSDDFCDLISQLATNNINHTGSREQIFKTVTDTYHLELATVDSSKGVPTSAFVLLTRPITATKQEREALKLAITFALCGRKSSRGGDHFYVGTRKVRVVDDSKPSEFYVDCKLCKSELHRTIDCPLPRARGWRGVQPKNIGFTAEAEVPKAATKQRPLLESVFERLSSSQSSSGRGRGRGGENRGRGGRGGGGRGKMSSRR